MCWLVSGRGLQLSSARKVKSSFSLVGPKQQQVRSRGGSHLGNLTRRGLRKREGGGRTVAANALQTHLSSSSSSEPQPAASNSTKPQPAASCSSKPQPAASNSRGQQDPAVNNSQQQKQVPVAAPAASFNDVAAAADAAGQTAAASQKCQQ